MIKKRTCPLIICAKCLTQDQITRDQKKGRERKERENIWFTQKLVFRTALGKSRPDASYCSEFSVYSTQLIFYSASLICCVLKDREEKYSVMPHSHARRIMFISEKYD